MLRAHYNWTRYWYLKGENIHVDGVGFPYDPGILNKNLVTFDSITHIPCLILFGEPGIGKSTVLESAYHTLLCDEINESRVASRRVGDLKAEERVAIAARIAAAGVFSNCGMISKKSGARKQWPDVVTFDEIRGGREPVGAESVEVTDAALAETLSTALFTPTDDDNTRRQSHQTYSEFLAAWYLKQRKAGTDRLSALLVHPSDPEQRIVPQLHEVAANTAHLVPGALQLVPGSLSGTNLSVRR